MEEEDEEQSCIDTYESSSRNSNDEDNNIDYNDNNSLVQLYCQSKKENKEIQNNFSTIILCLKELVDIF